MVCPHWNYLWDLISIWDKKRLTKWYLYDMIRAPPSWMDQFIHMVDSFLVYCNSRSLVIPCLSLYDTLCHLRTLLTRNDSTKDRTLNIADSSILLLFIVSSSGWKTSIQKYHLLQICLEQVLKTEWSFGMTYSFRLIPWFSSSSAFWVLRQTF